jgi:hypothetical protein
MASYRGLVFGVVVVLGVLSAGLAQNPRGPGKEVLDLARQAEEGKDVASKAAALTKRFNNVRGAMNLYNPRSRNGIGYGTDGIAIERKLSDLEEKPLDAQTLKKEAPELIRVVHINLVMAEVLRGFAPKKPILGKGKKEWDRDLDGVKTASRDLLKAIKAGSPRDVQAAATRINTACNNCHDGK